MEDAALSIPAVQIAAAARERAGELLCRPALLREAMFLPTETSTGAFCLRGQFKCAGYAATHPPNAAPVVRSPASVSTVAVARRLEGCFAGVTLPGRVAAVLLGTEPAAAAGGVDVPTRAQQRQGRAKPRFVASLLATLDSPATGPTTARRRRGTAKPTC